MGIFPFTWLPWLYSAVFAILALFCIGGLFKFPRLRTKGIFGSGCLVCLVALIGAYLTGFTFHLNTSAPVSDNQLVYLIPSCLCNPDSIVDTDIDAVRVRDGHVQWRHPVQSNGFLGGVNFSSDDHNVYLIETNPYNRFVVTALDGHSGHQVWQVITNVGGRLVSVANGRIMLAGIHTTLILDAATGKELLRLPVEDSYFEHDGVVYTCTGLNSALTITATDEVTGHKLWTSPNVFGCGLALTPDLLIANGNGILSAILIKDGSLVWQVNEGADSSSPIVDGDTIFSSIASAAQKNGDGMVVARRASDGSLLWQKPMGTSPALYGVTENIVLVATNLAIVALGGSDGRQLWSYPQASGYGPIPVKDGVVILTQSVTRQIIALDLHTGSFYWQTTL